MFYILMYSQTWGDNHAILYGASMLVVCSMAIHWFGEGHIDLSIVPYGIWNNFIMIIYSVLTGIFVAFNYSAMLSSCITYAAFSTICVAICYVSSEEHSFEWVYNTIIVISIICVLYTMIRGTEWKGYGITLSSSNNPHFFAAVMNLGIFSVAFKCHKHEIKEFVISGAIIILFLFGVIECGSRKYLLASIFIIAIWGIKSISFILKNSDTNQKMIFFFILSAIVVMGFYYYTTSYNDSNIHSRMMNADDDGNIKRIWFYQKAIDIVSKRPLFGGGYDQFRYWSGSGAYSHSTYAEAIADFGVVGTIIYFLPIILFLCRSIKKAIIGRKMYNDWLMLSLCISELFVGVGQIFFMEFYHFIAWTILFCYEREYANDNHNESPLVMKNTCKYIRT